VCDRLRYLVGYPADQLGISPDGGERGTQLVARVGDEMPYPGLARLPGGECVGDVTEHPVQRRAHLTHLGTRVGVDVGNPYRQSDFAPVQR
jgi:hypothetical protein